MTQTKEQSHSEIIKINSLIKNNLPAIIKHFNIDLNSDNKQYFGCCPLHNGADNPKAFVIYKNSGVWQCFTHGCHNKYGKSGIGLIKGLLSLQKNKDVYLKESIEFTLKFLNKEIDSIPIDEIAIDKQDFIRKSKLHKAQNIISNRESYRKIAKIPAEYYLKRGYSVDILDKYDVGLYKNKSNEFYNRVVIPIYDINYRFIIGFTARSIFEKCLICGFHHNKRSKCIDKQYSLFNNKWQHSAGFNKTKHLYNIWFAKNHIKKSIILVEGPGNVLRLEDAGIHNSVAIFGSSISQYQSNIIKRYMPENVIVLCDNDEAGVNATTQIKKVLGNSFNYKSIELERNDIADYSKEEVRELCNFI